jgi:hypothetical protein
VRVLIVKLSGGERMYVIDRVLGSSGFVPVMLEARSTEKRSGKDALIRDGLKAEGRSRLSKDTPT